MKPILRRTAVLRAMREGMLVFCLIGGMASHAKATALEFMVLGEDDAEPESAERGMQSLRVFGNRLMDHFAPTSIPLYAATDLYGYGLIQGTNSTEALGVWASSNQPWLSSMSNAMLAVRQKQLIENALLDSRRAEQQRRNQIVQRAGQPAPQLLPEQGGRMGVRLQDILLQYSKDSRSEPSIYHVDGNYREIDPFAAGNGESTMESMVNARIDFWISEQFEDMLPEGSETRAALSSTLDVAGRAAQQISRWENKVAGFLRGGSSLEISSGLGGNLSGGTLRTGPVGGWNSGGNDNRQTRHRDRQSIGLLAFALGLLISAVKSPLTYLIIVPFMFAWVLFRLSRPRGAEH